VAFWKKKREIEEIKEAVGEKKADLQPRSFPLPEKISRLDSPIVGPPKGPLPFETPTMGSPVEYKPMPETVKVAPLFIKIERYREVLENIDKLKVGFQNIENVFKIKGNIDRLKSETDALLEKSIKKFAEISRKLDQEFSNPQSPENLTKPIRSEKIDEHVNQLRDELTRLETRIRDLK